MSTQAADDNVLYDTQAVVERLGAMVHAIALTHTGNRGDAEDVFQEVFLTYHRRLPELNGPDHLQAWIITTTVNIARRVASSSWRTKVVPLKPEMLDLSAAPPRFDSDEQAVLFQALAGLPEIYRTVIHLFYLEDMPVARIAETLDLAPSAVKMRLSRGRAMLRQQLTKEARDA